MAGSGFQPLNYFMVVFPFVLSTGVVGTRIWRRITDHRFAVEDVLMLISQILLAGLTAATLVYIKISWTGYHPEDIPANALDKTLITKWRYINRVVFCPIIGTIKLSFLITLVKLQSANRWINFSLWTLFAINLTYLISATIAALTPCVPVRRFWDNNVPGTCQNPKQYVYSTMIVAIVTDILVTAIPAWIVYGLQMPRKEKITVVCFMSLGLLVTAVATYRLWFYTQIFGLPNYKNESPHNVRIPLSNIEGNLAAIAASGASLKWILGRFIPFFNSDRLTHNGSKAYTMNGSVTSNPRHIYKSRDEIDLDVVMADKHNTNAVAKKSTEEMEDQIGWNNTKYRVEADAQSDEQQIVGGDRGITKTVAWNVVGREGRTRPTTPKTMV